MKDEGTNHFLDSSRISNHTAGRRMDTQHTEANAESQVWSPGSPSARLEHEGLKGERGAAGLVGQQGPEPTGCQNRQVQLFLEVTDVTNSIKTEK